MCARSPAPPYIQDTYHLLLPCIAAAALLIPAGTAATACVQELDDAEAKFRLITQQAAAGAEEELSQLTLGGAAGSRRPLKSTPYALCLRAGLGGWVSGLGLSAAQLAENVEATYQKHQAQDLQARGHLVGGRGNRGARRRAAIALPWPRARRPHRSGRRACVAPPLTCFSPRSLSQVTPLEHSASFVAAAGGFSTPEGVLKGGCHVAATQIAAEPLVRQEVRKQYEVRATSRVVLLGAGGRWLPCAGGWAK